METTKPDAAEAMLRKHSAADFGQGFAAVECLEATRFVEDNDFWKGRYGSLEEFYVAT